MSELIKISGACMQVINFAMQQNQVPVISKLYFKNTTAEKLENIKISITSDPNFAEEWTTVLSAVEAGDTAQVEAVNLKLSPSFLFGITERINGNIKVTARNSDDEFIGQFSWDISVLAWDEWSGVNVMPEIIAAFVTPNHPYISKILSKAAAYLKNGNETVGFTGYQTKDPEAVKAQMYAIFQAISQEQISYCVPPASFESMGQRIRLCDTIESKKLGTCLDFALLYAGCLEAAGLNPMIVFTEGHAFTACWLIDECFTECVQGDVSMVKKRTAQGVNEICAVETTAMAAENNVQFFGSVFEANDKLSDEQAFHFIVDICRSRGSGIRPIPLKTNEAYAAVAAPVEVVSEVVPQNITAEPEVKSEPTAPAELTRRQLWERKLLDLSLRNPLLNFRPVKSSLQIITYDLSALEDALSGGEEFVIMHRPNEFDNCMRDGNIYKSERSTTIEQDIINSEFKKHRLRTYLNEAEVAVGIKNLYRGAKLSIEENGANTLYLAFGFLRWYESEAKEKARYAPLVLLPVDIVRKSAQKGYVIRLRDEEPQFNITLLEMLRCDFGIEIYGLDNMPADSSGLDLNQIFSIIQKAVLSKSGWDVEKIAFLGLFSFSQFIMWNDIHNRGDELAANKVVKSLMSGKMEWRQEGGFPLPGELDEKYSPVDLAVPLSADSSQLAAIGAAGAGNSFVLHGPPGTGKSQTITNMIANALYQGKSVLFIAEKMAALSVVWRRLQSVGLAPFCLELHSNKAKKKDVLAQLDNTMNFGRRSSPEAFEKTAESLKQQRAELNEILRAIHLKRNFGYSLYDAVTDAEKFADYPDCIDFSKEFIEGITAERSEEFKDVISRLKAAVDGCGTVENSVFKEISFFDYSPIKKDELVKNSNEFINLSNGFKAILSDFADLLGFAEINSAKKAQAAVQFASVFMEVPYLPAQIIRCENLKQLEGDLLSVCAAGKKRNEIERKLLQDYTEGILSYDPERPSLEWQQSEEKWFLSKLQVQNRLLKEVKAFSKSPKSVTKENIVGVYEILKEYNKNVKAVNDGANMFVPLFGAIWSGGRCDFDEIYSFYQKAVKIKDSINTLCGSFEERESFYNKFEYEALSDPDAFKSANGRLFSLVSEGYNKYSACENKLICATGADFEFLFNVDGGMDKQAEIISGWIENSDRLRDWSSYLVVKSKCEEYGISELCTLLEKGSIKSDSIHGVFMRNFNRACANVTIESDSKLVGFNGAMLKGQLEKFKETDDEFARLTVAELSARLSANLPVLSDGVSDSSEMGILQRAIRSGGRGISIRRLFDSIPTLLRKMCPCMLMSPMSVAQYINPSYPPFDLVIFDEASQLPTCEAVGAIARGKELIVVGDPKQLPPTSFFTADRTDEENFEQEDLESVLDDCLAITMPQEHLLWHYRSRHESLIAFSNRQYYENKLYTFPSPKDLVSEVKFIPVDGYYDRGKTKQNKAEAQAVVNEIIRRLSDGKLSTQSIGVVTFSVVQQHLIEDMLEEEFTRHPLLEKVAHRGYEPIFVKNLENVQGDERDVIMFSVGYGPDENGKVALNFGPLNRDGGWRRLNVAVTRAKREMLVFSTLKPEQIDLNKSSSDGVAGLKAFLEFASRGKDTLDAKSNETSGKKEGAEQVIAERIRELGYTVNTNIGCSEYKVDIGIVHPDKPDEYILGIMCDGDMYSRTSTARDRNILQQSVLTSLGWNVHRLWTIDWWTNSKKELEKIDAIVKSALEAEKTNKPEPPKKEEPKEQIQELLPETVVPKEEFPQSVYQAYSSEVKTEFTGDEFFAPANSQKIQSEMIKIISSEAPISKKLLFKRVCEIFGVHRITAKIEVRLEQIFSYIPVELTKSGENVFIWSSEKPSIKCDYFRVSSKEDERSKRSFEDIPPQEIACGVKSILSKQIGLSRDELAKSVAKLFGFARCTSAMLPYINAGIDLTVVEGFSRIDGDKIVLF